MIGQTLDHYRIQSKLGEGGMGVVYRARDTHLGRTVAIKVLPAERVADPGRKQRFAQEARAASALNHPNIVNTYDVRSEGGMDFIVMEYIEGQTLKTLIPPKGMSPVHALKYAAQIADALAKAHSAGIIHRDLKPSNIMVTDDGRVKVLDFGVAKLLEPVDCSRDDTTQTARTLTETGAVLGTAAYMSPEQAEGRNIDARSDIFSFGSVLYEMLCGEPPFQGDSTIAVLSAVVRDEARRISQVARDVPPELEKLVERCLRKDPQRRFQHAADIRVLLEELKEDQTHSTTGAIRGKTPDPLRSRTLALSAALVVAVAAMAAISSRLGPFRTAATPPKVAPFTSFAGRELEPAVSPDGKQVAFVWDGEGADNFDIYVKLIDGGTPLRLTANPGEDRQPAWSPNGRDIAFCRRTPAGAEIISVPALGGPERKHGSAQLSWPASGFYLRTNPFGLSWSPDGKWLAIIHKDSEHEPNHVALLSTDTGERHRLTQPPAGHYGDWLSAFSPDGRSLAFVRVRGYLVSDLYIASLSTSGLLAGAERRVTHDNRDILGLAWTPDGRNLVFSSSRGGVQRLWKVATSDGVSEQLSAAGENAHSVSVSRREAVLVYTRQMLNANIWRVPGLGAATNAPTGPERLISSSAESWAPRYSPDGGKIAFKSNRSGTEEIWVTDSNGSNPMQLTYFGGPATGKPHWSHDGQRIAFFSRKEGHADVYVIGAYGGAPRRLTTETSDESFPSWSRDDKWMYFSSNRGGAWDLWRMPVEGGAAVQITHNGGVDPVESFDGKTLYFAKRSGPGIWRVSIHGGEEVKVLDAGTPGAWALAESGVYLLDETDRGPGLTFFDFSSRRISRIASLPKESVYGLGGHDVLAVSPGAKSIIYVQMDRVESDLVLVQNYR